MITLPQLPQNSLGPSGTRIPVSTFRRGFVSDLSPFHPPRWSLLSPHYPAASYAWQLRFCGQGRRGLMGASCPPPPHGGQCVVSGTHMVTVAMADRCLRGDLAGPGADAEKPPLPHASRTNKTLRSGLCEGLVAGPERRTRGLAAVVGGVWWLSFLECGAAQSSR